MNRRSTHIGNDMRNHDIEPDSDAREQLASIHEQIVTRKKEIRELRKRQNAILAAATSRNLPKLSDPTDGGTKRILRDLAAA